MMLKWNSRLSTYTSKVLLHLHVATLHIYSLHITKVMIMSMFTNGA